MGFGNRLKKLLKEKNMTIKELSEKTGISINTLYSITKRDTRLPNDDILFRISTALNIDIDELMTLQDMENRISEHLGEIEKARKNIEKAFKDFPEVANRFTPEELTAISRFLDFVNNSEKAPLSSSQQPPKTEAPDTPDQAPDVNKTEKL